ncbi:hypothetical protein Pint_04205 [Pistacia integerrima]|uniref:Uncharacterized protein n=1 Tax=Pistacia integerrima TaxID=434235 RepID=A0ACC0Z851_9ROSI|nr:hypothetical protein Pint_04205 [Pistacia integerrima]
MGSKRSSSQRYLTCLTCTSVSRSFRKSQKHIQLFHYCTIAYLQRRQTKRVCMRCLS